MTPRSKLFRIVIVALALVCSTNFADAQMRAFDCAGGRAPSQKGSEILDRVQKIYDQVHSFRAKFSQASFLAALDQSEDSGGQILFTKPGRMKWLYAAPKE